VEGNKGVLSLESKTGGKDPTQDNGRRGIKRKKHEPVSTKRGGEKRKKKKIAQLPVGGAREKDRIT